MSLMVSPRINSSLSSRPSDNVVTRRIIHPPSIRCASGSTVMSQHLNGYRVLVWQMLVRPYKVSQWLPCRGSYYYLTRGAHSLFLAWLPWQGGYRLLADRCVADHRRENYIARQRIGRLTVKRREALGLSGVAPAPAASTSVIWSKLPAVREWLCCTEYDDKSIRVPGALRVTTRDGVWALTLTDPDACARLLVSDPSLDKALLLMEQLLGVPEAPWQADPYASQNMKKKKKS